jgi:hypothetical protein
MLDMTGTASGSDVPGIATNIYLMVKAVSTNPAVIGIAFTLTSNVSSTCPVTRCGTGNSPIVQSNQVMSAPLAFPGNPEPRASAPYTASYLFNLVSLYVPTSVQVQELKASSLQMF